MKRTSSFIAVLVLSLLFIISCKKNEYREYGYCYCKYFSGDKKKYDLTMLDRDRQVDSCRELNRLASGFAGDCELE